MNLLIASKTYKKWPKDCKNQAILKNKEEKSRKRYKNLSEEEKDQIKEYQRKRYQEMVQCKKEAFKNK